MSHQAQVQASPSHYNINPSRDHDPNLPTMIQRWLLKSPSFIIEKASSVIQNSFALATRARDDLSVAGVTPSATIAGQYKNIAVDYDNFSEEAELLESSPGMMSYFELRRRSSRLSVRAREFDYKAKSFSDQVVKVINKDRRQEDIRKENTTATPTSQPQSQIGNTPRRANARPASKPPTIRDAFNRIREQHEYIIMEEPHH